MPPILPDEEKNFGGSLVLDFRKWWRHVKTIYKKYVVWTGENDTKTIGVDANRFENGAKQLRFRLKTD